MLDDFQRDLTFTTPDGWNAPIVVSTQENDFNHQAELNVADPGSRLFLSFAIASSSESEASILIARAA